MRLAASFLAVLALVAAAQAGTSPTIEPGRLTVGLSMPTPGFQVGAVVGPRVVFAKGLEIDLARAISRKLGIANVRFVNDRKFANVYAPGDKHWDFALAEVTITPQRARNVDFSRPYLSADTGVLARMGLPSEPTSIEDLRGLRLCTQRGTTAADLIAERIQPRRRPMLLSTENLMLQRVQTGACDAAVFDLPVLATLRAQAPERYGPLVGRIETGEEYGIVLEKGNPLRAQVDEALAALEADGTIEALVRKWLRTEPDGLRTLR
jgi:polar amino acid transport system substrate-binding protein